MDSRSFFSLITYNGFMKRTSLFIPIASMMMLLSSCGSNESIPIDYSIDPQGHTDEAGFTFNYYDSLGGYVIEDYRGQDKDVYIPKEITYDGLTAPVKKIASRAFENRNTIETVHLSDNIISLDAYTFAHSSVKSVYVTGSLAHIDPNAFANSSVQYNVKDGISYLPGQYGPFGYAIAFNGEMDAKITLPNETEGINDDVFTHNEQVTISAKTTALGRISQNASYLLPNGLEELSLTKAGKYALTGIKNVRRLSLLESCYVEEDAFKNCSIISLKTPASIAGLYGGMKESLQEVTIYGKGRIPNEAFQNCENLSSLTLNEGITAIGEDAFHYCFNLTEVSFPSSIIELEYGCFGYNEKLTKVTFKEGLQKVGSGVFSDCFALKRVEFPSTVTSFGTGVFACCYGLESVSIPSSTDEVGAFFIRYNESFPYNEYGNAYYIGNDENPYLALIKAKNTSITSCEVSSKCRIIASYAFDGCVELESCLIPNGVENIGSGAFYNCPKLSFISFPSSLKRVDSPFSNSDKIAFQKSGGLSYLGDESNPYRVLIESNSYASTFEISSQCEIIAGYAFNGEKYLQSITIPETVKYIGNGAFRNIESLQNAVILGNDTILGDELFDLCKNLTTITLPKNLTAIGEFFCSYCEALSSIVLPQSLTKIGGGAFARCTALSNLILPASISYIGTQSFYGCTGMSSISLASDKTHWQSIIKEPDWNKDSSIRSILCQDGEIKL